MRFALCLLFTWVLSIWAPRTEARLPSVPVSATAAIVEAFVTHDVVAISHHDDQAIEFLMQLCGDVRFIDQVDYIVVEFGSAAHQATIDRYVAGAEVDSRELARVWEDTTDPSFTWDVPAVEMFFRTIRAVNDRSREKKLRILLGEPPIDWSNIDIESDLQKELIRVGNRDEHVAGLLRKRVFAERRKALVAYGALHFQRNNIFANYEDAWPEADTWLMQLSDEQRKKVFTLWRVLPDIPQAEVRFWTPPAIAKLSGTRLGALDFTTYFPYRGPRRKQVRGSAVEIPPEQWRSLSMEEQFDAVIYLGSTRSFHKWDFPAHKCSDEEYMKMRLGRMEKFSHTRGAAAELRRRCAS